jgi:hypothetical protein
MNASDVDEIVESPFIDRVVLVIARGVAAVVAAGAIVAMTLFLIFARASIVCIMQTFGVLPVVLAVGAVFLLLPTFMKVPQTTLNRLLMRSCF